MARNQSALSTLISEVLSDPSLAGDAVFRRLLEAGLQDLIDAEATTKIGAGRYERSESRLTRRNGSRDKTVSTPAGDVVVAIPKLREGSFFPSLLNPRKRIDKALYAVICQAWINGVSTRKVDELVKALGCESGISKSQVSRICADIDSVVEEFLTRPLSHTWYPYLFLDATYVDVRHAGHVVSKAVVVATGVSAQGRREILGMRIGDSESTYFWTEFLRSLRERGLKVSTDTDPLGVQVSPVTPTKASRTPSKPSSPAPLGNAAASTSLATSPRPWAPPAPSPSTPSSPPSSPRPPQRPSRTPTTRSWPP